MIKPPRLKPGDTIGLVAPASAISSPNDVKHAIEQVALLGLNAVPGKHVLEHDLYLAGTDAARADDFNTFARDPRIRGIFALRGGYGTTRMLDLIDYAAVQKDPKVLLGFSDLTALWNVITLKTGLVTFHGPVAAYSTFSPTVVTNIRNAVMSGNAIGVVNGPKEAGVTGGIAQGRLVGGNLTLVTYLAPTPYAVPTAGNILLLEDVHEDPYQVDAMLTELYQAGMLQSAAGIACGVFMEPDVKYANEESPDMTAMLKDRLALTQKPAVFGLQFGHIPDQFVLPLGLPATLDASAGVLHIDEPAVS